MWTPAERIKICVWLRHLLAKSFENVAIELMDTLGPNLENERDFYFTDTPDYALDAVIPVQERLIRYLPIRLGRGIDTWQEECAEALNVMRLLIRSTLYYSQFDTKLRNLRALVHAMEPYYLSTTGGGQGRTGRSWCIEQTNYPSYCQTTGDDTDFLHTVFPLLEPHSIFIQDLKIESGMRDYYHAELGTSAEEVAHFVFNDATLYQLFWDHYLPTLDFDTIWEQAQQFTQSPSPYAKEWFHFMEAERLLVLYPKTTKRRFDEMSSGTSKPEAAMIDGIPVLYVDDAVYWQLQ